MPASKQEFMVILACAVVPHLTAGALGIGSLGSAPTFASGFPVPKKGPATELPLQDGIWLM